MTSIHLPTALPRDVRVAIETFLKACQTEARPFASHQALEAIRSMSPDLGVSDCDLQRALLREAGTRGFEIDAPVIPASLEPDIAGGKQPRRKPESGKERKEARRRIVNDTVGTRRRALEIKERNRLV
ncbi:hypothetical protein [Aquamicrobium terrae]|uniref:Uncharacterized protein n=1 Tax=Aquamicrobium terrae TaxID=1324945 RepID=A0ABV2N6R1_9HYPH